MNKQLIIKEIYSLDELQSIVAPQEWLHAEGFRSERRRREWLSWRVALRESLSKEPFMGVDGKGIEVAYHNSGAPYIVGSTIPIYISVSHCRTHIAVLLSDTPCAVDMELLGRNFSIVVSRYVSDSESAIINRDKDGLAIGWCAKECAYKYIANQPLDFIGDITITDIDFEKCDITVQILEREYRARFIVEEGYCIVWME